MRVNVIPKKLTEGENNALTTPMSFTGTAGELDEQLPAAISGFVASHLELKNTLTRAKEEMDAPRKAAQEEARHKAKNVKKPGIESTKKAEPPAKEEPKKEPQAPRMVGLFDRPAEVDLAKPLAAELQIDEEEEILAEIAAETSEEDVTT